MLPDQIYLCLILSIEALHFENASAIITCATADPPRLCRHDLAEHRHIARSPEVDGTKWMHLKHQLLRDDHDMASRLVISSHGRLPAGPC